MLSKIFGAKKSVLCNRTYYTRDCYGSKIDHILSPRRLQCTVGTDHHSWLFVVDDEHVGSAEEQLQSMCRGEGSLHGRTRVSAEERVPRSQGRGQ